MAITPTIRAQTIISVAVGRRSSNALKAQTLEAVAVFNRHSTGIQTQTISVQGIAQRIATTVRVQQLGAVVVARGRTTNPNPQAWTFTLDGHDFYVLQLPTGVTLIYDMATLRWHVWGTQSTDRWRARLGLNWDQQNPITTKFSSNIICCDDSTGAMYFANPDYPVDDAPDPALPVVPFQRIVYGQVPLRGADFMPCFGVTISGSLGYVDDPLNVTVQLLTSDDQGHNFQDQGAQNMQAGQYSQRLYWPSLGSIQSPGRLFKIVDFGGLHRIDGVDMDDIDDKPSAA